MAASNQIPTIQSMENFRKQLNAILAGLTPGWGADLPAVGDQIEGATFFKTGVGLYQVQSGLWVLIA